MNSLSNWVLGQENTIQNDMEEQYIKNDKYTENSVPFRYHEIFKGFSSSIMNKKAIM